MSTFPKVSITHIGTATAVVQIGEVYFLTDPCFLEPGTHNQPPGIQLTVTSPPALQPNQLPVIDLVLLSHEDHIDNLDQRGRLLLDGRHVITTKDGASNLSPRPGVQGLGPSESTIVRLGGSDWKFTSTPCVHLPGGECSGFIIEHETFGKHSDGRPNAIWFSGDTTYYPGLATMLGQWHISVAIVNLGQAMVPTGNPEHPYLQITMNGGDAAKFYQDHRPDVIVPMHYAEWEHFTEHDSDLMDALVKGGMEDKVQWLRRGLPVTVN